MARYKKALIEAFKPHFKEHGFTKKDATWHLVGAETVHLFSIQTSQWSESYYFNVGVYFRALGPLTSPAGHHCHIQARIPDGKFHVASVESYAELSDFDGLEFGADERIVQLKNLIYPLAFNWFERFKDNASIKMELSQIKRPWMAVNKAVYPLLNLEFPS